jgi:hypothetical protein
MTRYAGFVNIMNEIPAASGTQGKMPIDEPGRGGL